MARKSDYMAMTAHFKKVNLYKIVKRILERYEWMLTTANTDQLWRGQNAEGLDLPMPYAKRTIDYKNKRGQPIDRITLKDRGDFYRSIASKFAAQSHEMVSGDHKAKYLFNDWGENILGLQKKEIEKISGEILDEVVIEIFNELMSKRNVPAS